MKFLKASLITALPICLAPLALNWLAWFVDWESFASVPVTRLALVAAGTYLSIVLAVYLCTRTIAAFGFLSRPVLLVVCWLLGLVLGGLLWYSPGSVLLSVGIALAFSVVAAVFSAPLIWLWWRMASGSIGAT
jgi:hypothetical protein